MLKQIQTNQIIKEDCINFLRNLPNNCIDLIITDPPYGDNIRYGWNNKKIQNNKNRIQQLRNDKEILRMRMDKLKNKDYDYIAEHARKLGYARPGEKIYRFVKNIEKTNNIKKTNTKQPSKTKFKIKDYLIYIITFLVVIIIYIILLLTKKRD